MRVVHIRNARVFTNRTERLLFLIVLTQYRAASRTVIITGVLRLLADVEL